MFVLYFTLSFLFSLFLTALAIDLMKRFKIIDSPNYKARKIHHKKIPLGGGLAIFFSFFALTTLAFVFNKLGNEISGIHLFGLFFGGGILMIGGLLDDRFTLAPGYQIIFPIIASLVLIASGIGPEVITNPLNNGLLRLDIWTISFGSFGNWLVLSDVIVFFWLMGMMFTTKFLDGLDGLVGGIVVIGALMITFLSLQKQWYQPEVALLSIIFSGACLGFLVWNWHPAKIFLGEGGSVFTGFILGTLAIISGGKIATTLLVMAVPMLDVARVIARRMQKRQPIYKGDNEHLHFKLLASGLSQRQAVLLLYAISFLFGMSTLFLQSRQKLFALLLLFILMLLIGVWFSRQEKRQAVCK